MKLFKKLFNSNSDKENEESDNSICSITLGVNNKDEYTYTVNWNDTRETTSDHLANILLGITYGFFTTDIVNILKENQDLPVNEVLFTEQTLQNFIRKKEGLVNIVSASKEDTPIIQPSKVFERTNEV
jgi:hypothetical protein